MTPLTRVGGYHVCRDGERLVILDERRAAVVVALARMRRELAAGRVEQQGLLLPDIVPLDASAGDWLESRGEILASLGVEIECVGPARHVVRSIPAALCGVDGRRLATELIAAAQSGVDLDQLLERAAGHAATVVGRMTTADMLAELDRLPRADHRSFCRTIGNDELALMFS